MVYGVLKKLNQSAHFFFVFMMKIIFFHTKWDIFHGAIELCKTQLTSFNCDDWELCCCCRSYYGKPPPLCIWQFAMLPHQLWAEVLKYRATLEWGRQQNTLAKNSRNREGQICKLISYWKLCCQVSYDLYSIRKKNTQYLLCWQKHPSNNFNQEFNNSFLWKMLDSNFFFKFIQ